MWVLLQVVTLTLFLTFDTVSAAAAPLVVAPVNTTQNPVTNATIAPQNSTCNITNGTQTSCFTGDPHFTTFDGFYYDYNGDCPFVFSQPCGNLSCGYANFSVRAKNRLLYVGAGISVFAEIEVEFYGQVLHLDQLRQLYVNGVLKYFPYFYPNRTNAQVTAYLGSGGRILISNNQGISVMIQNSTVCLTIPDTPALRGNGTLCGLAGNLDGNLNNDFLLPNGTYLTEPDIPYADPTIAYGDSWITTDFLDLDPSNETCATASDLPQLHACNTSTSAQQCSPVALASTDKGPFAACARLGNYSLL